MVSWDIASSTCETLRWDRIGMTIDVADMGASMEQWVALALCLVESASISILSESE